MQLDTVTQHREVARFCIKAPEQSTKPAFSRTLTKQYDKIWHARVTCKLFSCRFRDFVLLCLKLYEASGIFVSR